MYKINICAECLSDDPQPAILVRTYGLISCEHCDHFASYEVESETKPVTKCYEIYTKNPETGETCWEIKYVEVSTGDHLKSLQSFPGFDCIITQDYPVDGVYIHKILED